MDENLKEAMLAVRPKLVERGLSEPQINLIASISGGDPITTPVSDEVAEGLRLVKTALEQSKGFGDADVHADLLGSEDGEAAADEYAASL